MKKFLLSLPEELHLKLKKMALNKGISLKLLLYFFNNKKGVVYYENKNYRCLSRE